MEAATITAGDAETPQRSASADGMRLPAELAASPEDV
jgi:hypothetical protein